MTVGWVHFFWLIDSSYVVSGKRSKKTISRICADKPAVIALLKNVDQVAFSKLQFIGVDRPVVENRTVSKTNRFMIIRKFKQNLGLAHVIGSVAVSTCKTSVLRIVWVSRTMSEFGVNGDGDGIRLVTVVVVVVIMLFSKSSLPMSCLKQKVISKNVPYFFKLTSKTST